MANLTLVTAKERVVEELVQLTAARNLVTSSPEVLGGMLVIRGTRVPVYNVAASVAVGITIERILENYPSLDREKIELAVIFAEAHPPPPHLERRRPLPAGAVIVYERRIRRHKAAVRKEEARHLEGYTRQPVKPGEFDRGPDEHCWGAG